MPSSKEYQARYHREVWYPKNRERRIALNNAWKKKQLRLYEEYKTTLKCEICGEDENCCLDFHHKDPSKKEYTISIARRGKSFETLMKEIEKCIVLCANCHRKVHKGKLILPT